MKAMAVNGVARPLSRVKVWQLLNSAFESPSLLPCFRATSSIPGMRSKIFSMLDRPAGIRSQIRLLAIPRIEAVV
jgi:hypothetical protein